VGVFACSNNAVKICCESQDSVAVCIECVTCLYVSMFESALYTF